MTRIIYKARIAFCARQDISGIRTGSQSIQNLEGGGFVGEPFPVHRAFAPMLTNPGISR
jgi:hypothetical protein